MSPALSKDDLKIIKPYIVRWDKMTSNVSYEPSKIAQCIGVADEELDLPINLKDAPDPDDDIDMNTLFD